MRFSLKEAKCRIVNVNPRPEKHGDTPKPAADLKLQVMLPNDELDQFDKNLRDLFYEKATKGQGNLHALTQLRFPKLQAPVGWDDEVIGGNVTLHRGIDAKSNLEITGAILGKFTLEPLEGGSVAITFSTKFHPENDKQIGKLCMLTGTDVIVSVKSPTEREQEKQRDLLNPEPEEEPEAA